MMKTAFIFSKLKNNKLNLFYCLIFSLLFTCCTTKRTNIPHDIKLYQGIPTLDTRPFSSLKDYDVEEYLVKGTARSYEKVGKWGSDGFWDVKESDTASYVTRYVVVKPAETEKFNGVVIVEWLNVTGGFDFGPARIMMWRELSRKGVVWVGVSAQVVGVEGGATLIGKSNMYLKKLNPERYGILSHPGDAYSYDIYSQAGRFFKGADAPKILGGLVPKYIISIGESQSAMYLTTYINAVHPIDPVYDGFLNYSRFGFSSPIDGASIDTGWGNSRDTVRIRTDLKVPLIILETETDVIGTTTIYGYQVARQPDTDLIRTWEVPGTDHAGTYLRGGCRFDQLGASYEEIAKAWTPGTMGGVNSNPAHHYVAQAAMAALMNWVVDGVPPQKADRIELQETGDLAIPKVPVLDENGNAKGGIRSPWLDVPTAKHSGKSKFPGALAGFSETFDAEKLNSLYPEGIDEYLKKFEVALDKQIKKGFLLPADREEIMGIAKVHYKALE